MSKDLLGFIDDSKVRQAGLIDAIHQNGWKSNKEHDLQLFSSMLTQLTVENREEPFRTRILASLKFGDMDHRHETIATAYQKTFDWIFEMHSSDTA
jgi:hypothetical protein